MNLFVAAADCVIGVMLVCLVSIVRGTAIRRIIASQVFTFLGAVALVLFSIGYDDPDFCDLGIALAILSFGGTLAYAHFWERWT
jgi:multisubunit Na+/H+ antiporter MnhF subunit